MFPSGNTKGISRSPIFSLMELRMYIFIDVVIETFPKNTVKYGTRTFKVIEREKYMPLKHFKIDWKLERIT